MLSNLFSWLRSSVRDAVLNGVNDALDILDGGNRDATAAPQLDALRIRLQPALVNAPANLPSVPQDERADEMAQQPTHRTNGRKRATAATATGE